MRKKDKKKNAEYRAFIDTLPCMICGKNATHHHESIDATRAISSKEPDTRCVPLCAECHNKRHQTGFLDFYKTVYPYCPETDIKTARELVKGAVALDVVKYLEMFIEHKRYA